MRVIVYVEGPSDHKALQALLAPVISAARDQGVGVAFSAQGGKAAILNDVPRKAADHLHQHEKDWVFAVPDLYPMAGYDSDPKNRHGSFDEMRQLLEDRFHARADKLQLSLAVRKRFRVHCLKHDLEALLLAAPDVLRERLKTKDALRDAWRRPVEDQNDKSPPKRVVEELFKKYRRKPGYVDTSDAVWILERASLDGVVAACPQRFGPFVRELRAIIDDGDVDVAATVSNQRQGATAP